MKDVSCYPDVASLLFHEPPMVLVDRLVSWTDDGKGVRCEVNISRDSMFAEKDGVPAFVGIEYMAQTIGVYVGALQFEAGLLPKIGYLLGGQSIALNCDRFTFGQRLVVEAIESWNGGRVVQFDCRITDSISGSTLVSGLLNCYDPEEKEE